LNSSKEKDGNKMFDELYDFTAANGVDFRAVIGYTKPYTLKSQRPAHCGLSVTFYDRRYPHTPNGQHTGATYYLETLLEDYEALALTGLNLHGDVDCWQVDARSMRTVLNWLMEVYN
jgi:hypothetical protein